MPSHVYARTGRYEDARTTNVKAVAVDEKYIADQKPEGVYPLMYYNHNIQFIWFTSCREGNNAEALAAARKMTGNLPIDLIRQMSMLELAPPYPIMTLARFGRWDDVLAEPGPPSDLRYASGVWHYARGLARAAKGSPADAQAELDSVRALSELVPPDQPVSINFAKPILRMSASALAGEIARRGKQMDEAVRALRAAVAIEDSLHYDEPPTWYYPVRHMLGAALLEAGNPREAEAVYRDDQLRHPENGWSLFGLAQALRAEGLTDEANRTEERFKKAWGQADVVLTGSAY
jgi:tetratricopeptide (TPR) repeat protein